MKHKSYTQKKKSRFPVAETKVNVYLEQMHLITVFVMLQ